MNILIIFMATMYAKFANSKNIFESACKKLVLTRKHCHQWSLHEGRVHMWHLDRCIPAKKRSSKRRGVIHSFLNINEFCKRIMEIQVFV